MGTQVVLLSQFFLFAITTFISSGNKPPLSKQIATTRYNYIISTQKICHIEQLQMMARRKEKEKLRKTTKKKVEKEARDPDEVSPI
jgi:hypothetical protein